MAALKIVALMALMASGLAVRAADTMTGIFNDRIRTLRIHSQDDELGLPVIIGSNDYIEVSFDHLSDEREYFRYSLTHCDANWQPSALVESEYIDGFNEGTIDDYDFSAAATVHYVHYSLTLPNEQMQPQLSGNYLLKVYPETDPDSIVLQARFMISEQTAPVSLDLTTRTDVDYNESSQQLQIEVNTERAGVEDPFNDMLVVVGQNGRLDNERSLRQPMRMMGTTAVYEYTPALIFEAGNEYRRFETVSDYYPGMKVERINFYRPYYHYTLSADMPRDEQPYLYDKTQNGRYVVRRTDTDDGDVEADYGVVHFILDMPYMPGHRVYIDGDLTLRRFDAASMMAYNDATQRYEKALLLKQGSYNYQYLVVPPGGTRGYTKYVEGDKYQTVNEYLVRVYHRRRGERYDRLIGVAVIRSDFSTE